MATTRPEARETTGTLREISGVTAPVTTNSEVVGCAVASASGNCSGWSTVNRLRSTSGTMLAGGGASAAASTYPLLQSTRVSSKGIERKTRTNTQPLLFISESIFATTFATPSDATPCRFSRRRFPVSVGADRAAQHAAGHRKLIDVHI